MVEKIVVVEKVVVCMQEPTAADEIMRPDDWPLLGNADGSTTISLETSLRILSTLMYLNAHRTRCRALQSAPPPPTP